MKYVELKSIATFLAVKKGTQEPAGCCTFDDAYDPTIHEPAKFHYHENLRPIINGVIDPQRGADAEELAKSARLFGFWIKAKGKTWWELEDADYEFLATKMRATRWMAAMPWFEEFKTDILTPHGDPPASKLVTLDDALPAEPNHQDLKVLART